MIQQANRLAYLSKSICLNKLIDTRRRNRPARPGTSQGPRTGPSITEVTLKTKSNQRLQSMACPLESRNATTCKIVCWTVAKHITNNGKQIVTAKRELAQEESKLTKIFTPRPQGNVLDSFGLFLGRLSLGGGQVLNTSLAYVLRLPKTMILPFRGFGFFK